MVNRVKWTVEEDKVLKVSVNRMGSMQAGAELASQTLHRSKGSCYQRYLYLKGKASAQKKDKATKKLRAKLVDRGVRVHGNKVFITPTDGIQVIFCNS